MSDLVTTCKDSLDVLDSGMASREQLLTAMQYVKALGDAHRELKERVDTAAIKWIGEHGPFEDGGRKYWVAPNKTTKCKNLRQTVEAVMQATGGDYDAFVDCLSSGAFKPGAVKKVLGENFDKCFETNETEDLKTKEVGVPKLQTVDTKFLT